MAYAADAGIRCTGGSPHAVRWMFSAMSCARASRIPSVHPDTCGVINVGSDDVARYAQVSPHALLKAGGKGPDERDPQP